MGGNYRVKDVEYVARNFDSATFAEVEEVEYMRRLHDVYPISSIIKNTKYAIDINLAVKSAKPRNYAEEINLIRFVVELELTN